MGAISRFLGNVRIWPGPILAVELLTMSRRTRYFVLRTLYPGALLFALWVTYQGFARFREVDINAVAMFSAAFFGTFGTMQLVAILLVGPALTAGTIAQERERRTMEYLYATPLSNLEIIIGKLGGRVMQILYLVLSGVPVLALAMLLGGIAPRAIINLAVITLSTVVFVTMVSLAVSACTATARDAVLKAYLVFFCIWVLPYPLIFLFHSASKLSIEPALEQVIVTNPLMTFFSIINNRGPWGAVFEPWALVRNQLLAGGTSLGLAAFFMRRIHLRESGKPARKRRWRLQLFRGRIGDKPMYWKELYAEPGSSRLGLLGYGLMAAIFAVVCGITIYMYLDSIESQRYYPRGDSLVQYAVSMGAFLSCCGLLVLTARAASAITSEKERDCWVSLIATPLDGRQIITAKILGNFWSLRWLAPFVAVVWLPALIVRPDCCLFGITLSLLQCCILAAFAATLGVAYSLGAKNTLRAIGAALGTVLLVGGGYLMCCCPVIAIGSGPGSGRVMELGLAPCIPFLLGWPGAACQMIVDGQRFSEFGGFMAACLLGTIGYLVATAVLFATNVESFDAKSERAPRRRGLGIVPPPAPKRNQA
jgi:ABC-type transport system involved in multi-copper enzyme maturation permease subunit